MKSIIYCLIAIAFLLVGAYADSLGVMIMFASVGLIFAVMGIDKAIKMIKENQ